MTLIKSISGIRGTIGGKPAENLTPPDIVKFTSAFGWWLKEHNHEKKISVVTGRDSRTSGKMIANLVNNSLISLGIDVVDIGMASTPTVEVAVTGTHSAGGIIITASHNPAEWNALKLLNENGEFLSATDAEEILEMADSDDFIYASHKNISNIINDSSWIEKHIEMISEMELTDKDAIKKADFKVVVDCINSVGALIIPELLKKLGVEKIVLINATPDGNFAHNPEPLPENLTELSSRVISENASLGFAVDPDVDRLAIVCDDGTMFGEEYTLVSVADYVLQYFPGNTVSNMSSSRALRDITIKRCGQYFTASVGEINVIEEMKKRNAVIGGEGNGGVIFPAAHYGRDALIGIALFLSYLAKRGLSCKELRKEYPDYFISKKKIEYNKKMDFKKLKEYVKKEFSDSYIDERDGIRVENEDWWIHVRVSNTEPIIRIYAEASSPEKADELTGLMISIVKNL
ncbi:MAG: phosphoglucosamine mutase [Bacteroidales bacterium]|nr:phosphoglucosamine mutase [Bacteroidales bacterium]